MDQLIGSDWSLQIEAKQQIQGYAQFNRTNVHCISLYFTELIVVDVYTF